jgi:hypothetical protein
LLMANPKIAKLKCDGNSQERSNNRFVNDTAYWNDALCGANGYAK